MGCVPIPSGRGAVSYQPDCPSAVIRHDSRPLLLSTLDGTCRRIPGICCTAVAGHLVSDQEPISGYSAIPAETSTSLHAVCFHATPRAHDPAAGRVGGAGDASGLGVESRASRDPHFE